MKNYSRVLSLQSLENIYVLKLASKASQENFEKFVFLTTKYEQIVNLEHLLCPKVFVKQPKWGLASVTQPCDWGPFQDWGLGLGPQSFMNFIRHRNTSGRKKMQNLEMSQFGP